jgi:apolipoprotein N-acyltransferase
MQYSLALLAGILLALSFPKFGHPLIAWIALVPLLVAALRGSGRAASPEPLRAWRLGFVTGGAYFAGTLYWIAHVIQTYGGRAFPVAWLITAALVAYLALFPALFALGIARVGRRSRGAALFLAPAIWVSSELARAHLLTGFPWVLLGYSETAVLPIAQLASVLGVYGVSALVASGNAALAHVLLLRSRAAVFRAAWVGVGVAVIAVWGGLRLSTSALASQGSAMPIAIVQGNVRQEDKWDPAHADTILNRYLTMTRAAAQRGARLVVRPESATPFYFEEDAVNANRIRRLVREAKLTLLLGSDQLEDGGPPSYYNAAFVLGTDGQTAGVYRKVHLVPFGEYVPLKRLLFFVEPLVEGTGDFSPGDGVVTLPVNGSSVSTAICYEIVYPGLVRRSIRAGSQLLTTITNDAWFGDSSAPYQHFTQAAMRAIEQGRYLARSANTGISGIVDPYGRVVVQSGLFEPAILLGDVRLLSGLTVYGRISDVFAYACALLTLGGLVAGWRPMPTPVSA